MPSRFLSSFSPRREAAKKILLFAGLALFGGACFAVGQTEGKLAAVVSPGDAPLLLSGTAGPFTIQKPTGMTTFSVSFPKSFKKAPRVVASVVGSFDSAVVCRLSQSASTTGFQGVIQTPLFLHETSASVNVNWIALGE